MAQLALEDATEQMDEFFEICKFYIEWIFCISKLVLDNKAKYFVDIENIENI